MLVFQMLPIKIYSINRPHLLNNISQGRFISVWFPVLGHGHIRQKGLNFTYIILKHTLIEQAEISFVPNTDLKKKIIEFSWENN